MDSVTTVASLSLPTPGMKDFRRPAGLGVGRGDEVSQTDSGLELCRITRVSPGSEWGTPVVRDSRKDTLIGGQARKESTMGGIIILLRPAPTIDPFPAWKLSLCHQDTAKGKKFHS